MSIRELIDEIVRLRIEVRDLQSDLDEARQEVSIDMSLRFGREERLNRFKNEEYDRLTDFTPVVQDEDLSIFCHIDCPAFLFGGPFGYHHCRHWPGWSLKWLDGDSRRPIRCAPCLRYLTPVRLAIPPEKSSNKTETARCFATEEKEALAPAPDHIPDAGEKVEGVPPALEISDEWAGFKPEVLGIACEYRCKGFSSATRYCKRYKKDLGVWIHRTPECIEEYGLDSDEKTPAEEQNVTEPSKSQLGTPPDDWDWAGFKPIAATPGACSVDCRGWTRYGHWCKRYRKPLISSSNDRLPECIEEHG